MAIDEKKLIDEIGYYMKAMETIDSDTAKGIVTGCKFALLRIGQQIKLSLETKTSDKWIPCSERLPEEGVTVLCTEKGTQKVYVGWYLTIKNQYHGWLDSDGFSMDVIAWMPLPLAYKGE